jgi:hypothetical protein
MRNGSGFSDVTRDRVLSTVATMQRVPRGAVPLDLALPMPGVVRLGLTPVHSCTDEETN